MQISTDTVREVVRQLCEEANCELAGDVYQSLAEATEAESSPVGKDILVKLLRNSEIAKAKRVPLCQDTGMVVVFLEIGQGVQLVGPSLEEAINSGVRQAYKEHYFRHSVVADPILRGNTNDNTPAVIHCRIVDGENIRVIVAPKGFGSENMSALGMLKPAHGIEGIKSFVIDAIEQAGGNPCPPIVIGIGIGGTMEKAALMSKEALMRPIGEHNPLDHLSKLEEELLVMINQTGIGPQGFGGSTTALAVNILTYPTHIAGLPVAVNINCHVHRHREAMIIKEEVPAE